ncbi:MAG: adenosylcobinamide-phosphate synthase CbiB [Gemmatimonadota bacterium]
MADRGRAARGGVVRAAEVLAAGVADAVLGEPRVAHPVRGMGSALLAGRRWNAEADRSPRSRKLAGTALVLGGACLSWWSGRVLAGRARPGAAAILRRGIAVSWVISLRELLAAGRRVRRALEAGDLEGARASLARDLVSRNTRDLTADEVAGAAIQSLAENLNDAFVAPLFWGSVAGPGAAYAYRWVNTADAVLGYRTAELEDFGWAAARSDDVLGWIPARLTAAALILAAPTAGGSSHGALRALRASAHVTPSPNGGWPMAAAAGALDVRLEKRGAYVLNPAGLPPTAERLEAAERLIARAGGMAVALAIGLDLSFGRA